MWNGTWPSQQWPQQHMYQNVPPDQVDWAALAKQWIQMQQQQQQQQQSAPPQLQQPPPSHHQVPSIPPAPSLGSIKPTSPPNGPLDPFHSEPPIPGGDLGLGPVTIPPPPAMPSLVDIPQREKSWREPSSSVNEPGWSRNVEPWVPPPPPPPPGPLPSGVTFSGKYPTPGPLPGQVSARGAFLAHEHAALKTQPYLSSSDSGFWETEATKTLPFVKKEKESLLKPDDVHSSSSTIDMAKRKQLPAWIRDQLEKMDKVRQKSKTDEHSQMQPQMLPSSQTLVSNDDDIPEEEMIDDSQQHELNGKESSPNKSKFETDEESDAESSSESIDEEQRQREMMLFVKNLLTEVLLDVTNQEINEIAKNTYQKFRSRAPARQLATSSALASIASGFGGGESDKESEGSDSDTDIYAKIHEKKKAFALKEKKLMADLEPRHQDSEEPLKSEVVKSDAESEAESSRSLPKKEESFEKESSFHEPEEKSLKEKSLTPATKESSDSSLSSKENSKRKSSKHTKKEPKAHERHKKKRKKSRSRSRTKHTKRSRRSPSSSSTESNRRSHSRDRRKRSHSREHKRHKYRSSSSSSSSDRRRRSRSRDKYSKRRQRSYSRDSTPKKKPSHRRRHTSRSSSRGRRS